MLMNSWLAGWLAALRTRARISRDRFTFRRPVRLASGRHPVTTVLEDSRVLSTAGTILWSLRVINIYRTSATNDDLQSQSSGFLTQRLPTAVALSAVVRARAKKLIRYSSP